MEAPERRSPRAIWLAYRMRRREALAWALRFERPVIYVPGNHEFYGSSIDAVTQDFKRLCAGHRFTSWTMTKS